ncbi:MAG: hypothetical protein R6W70_03790 [bacterium]
MVDLNMSNAEWDEKKSQSIRKTDDAFLKNEADFDGVVSSDIKISDLLVKTPPFSLSFSCELKNIFFVLTAFVFIFGLIALNSGDGTEFFFNFTAKATDILINLLNKLKSL